MSVSQPANRILVLANYDLGLYKFRKALLLALQAAGYEIHCALPEGALFPQLEALGFHCISTPMERRGTDPRQDLALLGRYVRLIRQLKPRLVLTYTIKPNIYGGLACRLLHIPYAANITGLGTALQGSGGLQQLVLTLYRAALKQAHTVFFENAANREALLQRKLIRPEQACLLPGAGIDPEEYPRMPYPEDGPTRFLFVGRIMAEKGIEELIQAAKVLKAKYGSRITVELAGMYEDAYESRILQLQQEGILQFHGYQPDVRSLYAAASCIVLPSWHEGMSNVLLEAASMGRPLITTRIPGCMEAVLEGESGLLCTKGDASSLTEAMEAFYLLPRSRQAAMGLAGRSHMIARFDKKTVVAATMERLPL